MTAAAKVCIKCGYERRPVETAPAYQCPQCQVIYAKAEQAALGRTFTSEQQHETKRCPDCGEQVLAIATKCKHCGSQLGKSKSGAGGERGVDLSLPLLLLPLAGAVLIWLWVGGMTLGQNPRQTLLVLGAVVLLATASMAAWEISNAPTQKRAKSKLGPVGWFLVISLFWAFSYPLYMFSRSALGQKSRFGIGVLVALIFLVVTSSMAMTINNKQKEVETIARKYEEQADKFHQEAEAAQKEAERIQHELQQKGYNP